jgi:sensor histidine kinase regulating citrate/malate metabolism
MPLSKNVTFSTSFKVIVGAVLSFVALTGGIIGFDRTYVRVEQAEAIASEKAKDATIEVAQTLKSQQKVYERQQQINDARFLEILRCQRVELIRQSNREPNNVDLKVKITDIDAQIKSLEQDVYSKPK